MKEKHTAILREVKKFAGFKDDKLSFLLKWGTSILIMAPLAGSLRIFCKKKIKKYFQINVSEIDNLYISGNN